MAERSKTRVCSRSLAGIAGSNPAEGVDVCVVCCKYRQKGKIQHKQHKEKSTDEVQSTGENKIPGRARFSAPVQTGPGAHPSSYKMVSLRGVKRLGRDVNQRPPSSAEVKERVEL